jgi:hypothetical protein
MLLEHPFRASSSRQAAKAHREDQVHTFEGHSRATAFGRTAPYDSLTIAMLAESNVPLIIDQPEDDLDNAFIFSSIVTTLRAIKGRSQVILVTHNANIAVLGDSELILPTFRENDCGKAKGRGSIDTSATTQCLMDILEGGADAFERRKEIYTLGFLGSG